MDHLAEVVATPVPPLREMIPAEEDGMLREDGVREVLVPATASCPPLPDRSLSTTHSVPWARSELERP